MARKVKIVATIGPSTDNDRMVTRLIKAGVNVFRLNFSYGTHESHFASFSRVRRCAEKLNREVAVMQDICGPKIRIKGMQSVIEVNKGDLLTMATAPAGDDFGITYPELIEQLEIGDEVYFADGTVQARVTGKSIGRIELKSLTRGILREGKGVNIPKSGIKMSALTEKDKDDLRFAAKIGIDLVAVSFVENAGDIITAKEILKTHGSDAWVIAKIERKGAIKNLDSILNEVDGIMVARGDLGVEAGLFSLPHLQKEIIRKANEKAIPVITATQMLASMLHSPYATRAEISDIANAVLDGTDSVMLSDETAAGEFPVEAVKVMVKTIRSSEKDYPYHKDFKGIDTEAFAHSAAWLSKFTQCKAIASITSTGSTVCQIAKFRPKKAIYALALNERLKYKMALVWGVNKTFVIQPNVSETNLIYQFLKQVEIHQQYLITMGSKTGKGTTNMIRIIDEVEIKKIFNRFES